MVQSRMPYNMSGPAGLANEFIQQVYVLGGYGNKPNPFGENHDMNSFLIYDVSSDRWAEGPDMAENRWEPAAAFYGDKGGKRLVIRTFESLFE